DDVITDRPDIPVELSAGTVYFIDTDTGLLRGVAADASLSEEHWTRIEEELTAMGKNSVKIYFVLGDRGTVSGSFALKPREPPDDDPPDPLNINDACQQALQHYVEGERKGFYLLCLDYTHPGSQSVRMLASDDVGDDRAGELHMFAGHRLMVIAWMPEAIEMDIDLEGEPAP